MKSQTFADKLKAHKKRLGLTQPEMAELLDIPNRTYWEYESGNTEPPEITKEGALARLEKEPKK